MNIKTPSGDLQKQLENAIREGLRLKFGEIIGGLLGDVFSYYQQATLEPARLREILDKDSGAALNAIMSNKLDGTTLRLIQGQMIGSALVMDRAGVTRWATEGLNRCERAGTPWATTAPQWRWILEEPDRYMMYARELKRLLHQI